MTFGQYLRKHRMAAEVTQRDLAASLGCSHPFVCEVERGRRRLGERWWDALMRAIPSIAREALIEHRAEPLSVTELTAYANGIRRGLAIANDGGLTPGEALEQAEREIAAMRGEP